MRPKEECDGSKEEARYSSSYSLPGRFRPNSPLFEIPCHVPPSRARWVASETQAKKARPLRPETESPKPLLRTARQEMRDWREDRNFGRAAQLHDGVINKSIY